MGHAVAKLHEFKPAAEMLVVDDGSTDDTADEARAAGARVLRHPYNKGNGAAVKTGIRAAHGAVVLMMDADGQHQPEDAERLLALIGEYDLVVGARTLGDQSRAWCATWATPSSTGWRATCRAARSPT